MTTSSSFRPFPTGIASLDDLLTSVPDGQLVRGGFVHLPKKGFFGVIFGASCSGKSVISLQLACRFVKKKIANPLARHAVYLTQEPEEVIKERATYGFGFLDPSEIISGLDEMPDTGNGTLRVLNMPLDKRAQQERLIDVFELVNSRFCCENEKDWGDEKKDGKRRVLVVVDNAETIQDEAYLKLMQNSLVPGSDANTPAPRRKFCKMLREYCHRHRLQTWFTFEEDASQSTLDESTRIATSAEAYAADAVIRLGVTVQEGGFRERSLEIVKARDQFFRRGHHHFTVCGWKVDGFGGPSATNDKDKSGIVVFPSVPTQLHRLSRENPPPVVASKAHSTLGIDEIDQEVRFSNEPSASDGYLSPGTVSVLVADLDSMATDLALHFIAQFEEKHHARPGHWLYISFHHKPETLGEIAKIYTRTMACSKLLDKDAPNCLFLPPEHISDSKLLYDIDSRIKSLAGDDSPLGVVVDDLYALDSRFPLVSDKDAFIAALFQLFRARRVCSLVLDTVEVGEGRNPLDRSVPAGMADHVFLLRHIEFQTRMRKVFSIVKLAGFTEPSLHWELVRDQSKGKALGVLTADANRFQFFKGLLSGKPDPVEITLSLYADSPGSPQHVNLLKQQTILSKTFGQHIEIHPVHSPDYEVLQQTVGQEGLPVLGDCHIIAVDEIWLDELIHQARLKEFKHGGKGDSSFHWDEADYVTAAHDLACEHWGKATDGPARSHYAIPDRHNFGVLAYCSWLKPKFVAKGAKQVKGAGDIVYGVTVNESPSWAHLAEIQTAFVNAFWQEGKYGGPGPRPSVPKDHHIYRLREPSAQLLAEMREDRRTLPPQKELAIPSDDNVWGAFTFNMENRECCVSFLLELVLSELREEEGKDRDHLVDSDRNLVWNFAGNEENGGPWCRALMMLLRLLDPWDIQRLADCFFRPSGEERRCLFSRQWFTSWGSLARNVAGLEMKPLPPGLAGKPTPVSGTWYLGMLAESSAVRAGKVLIKRLTSPDDELYRLNGGIAMPVQGKLYRAASKMGMLDICPGLPYAQYISAMPDVLSRARTSRGTSPKSAKFFHEELRRRKCPFHRPCIKDYASISPVLMGLMVRAARLAISDKWLTDRSLPTTSLQKKIAGEVSSAKKRIMSLQKAEASSGS